MENRIAGKDSGAVGAWREGGRGGRGKSLREQNPAIDVNQRGIQKRKDHDTLQGLYTGYGGSLYSRVQRKSGGRWWCTSIRRYHISSRSTFMNCGSLRLC